MKQWILYLAFYPSQAFPNSHWIYLQLPACRSFQGNPAHKANEPSHNELVHITYWDMQLKLLLFNTIWKSTLKSAQSSSGMAEIPTFSLVNCSIPFSSICSRWELFKKWASMTHFYDQCTIRKMLSNQIAVQIRHVYCCKTKYAGWTECIHLY